MVNKALIYNYRKIVLPFVARHIFEANLDNEGEADKKEFESDFNKILDLAEQSLDSQWIPIKMRPCTDEEYKEFGKYSDCPREDFLIFTNHMPDDYQEVLITTRSGDVCLDIWHREAEGSYFEDHDDLDDVIAWMPKPEEYVPEV